MEIDLGTTSGTTFKYQSEPLASAEELAGVLGVSVRWVWDAARWGRIPCVPLGRNGGAPYRFRCEEVIAHLSRPAFPPAGKTSDGDGMVTDDQSNRRRVRAMRNG